MSKVSLEALVSLCKRRGFLYQGSAIYGGLSGTWDYGPLGVQIKRNLLNSWWNTFVELRPDIYGLDSAILMHSKTWRASGHLTGFVDPIVKDTVSGECFRLDVLLEDAGIQTDGSLKAMSASMKEHNLRSPSGNPLSEPSQFNLMFASHIGAKKDQDVYLRPETAQGIFVNFRNVIDSCQPDLPFGIAQIGKAFRNEISPRDFIFRSREFEQMEIEYFCRVQDWEKVFEGIKKDCNAWLQKVGVDMSAVTEYEVPEHDRAHYSQRTIDFEFKYPFGKKELYGLAYRGDYDLKSHQQESAKKLTYIDKKTQQAFLPVCIEPSIGVDRLFLAVLQSVYRQDKENERVYLAWPEDIAPMRYAVSPLLANKPELVQKARQVWQELQKKYTLVAYDAHGNIGKRYRRQDEIGTPWCITIDFQTLKDGSVTRRDRNTLKQERLAIDKL